MRFEGGSLRDWIVIFVLYVVVLFAFAWCGGVRAAGKSIEYWGRRSTTSPGPRRNPLS